MYSHEVYAEMIGRNIITPEEANAALQGADATKTHKKIADYYMNQPKVKTEYENWLRESLK